ncbi:MAG: OadG family protein [Lachnospiraceae bacterium]|nr:OadG family protein [Lachnospiraceae bacterium]
MKKWLLILGMITCIFGISACGGKKETEGDPLMTEEEAVTYGEQYLMMVMELDQMADEGMSAKEIESLVTYNGLPEAIFTAYNSWEGIQEDMGDYVGISEKTATVDSEQATVLLTVDGSVRDAKVEWILAESPEDWNVTISVVYSFAELMEKAALNTLLGMGTVFVVLILISIIIYGFALIPKIQEMFAKKSVEEPVSAPVAGVDNTITQIIEQEEQTRQEDDLELVAVIAAAIAASEGAATTEGFVVRSIRKRRF